MTPEEMLFELDRVEGNATARASDAHAVVEPEERAVGAADQVRGVLVEELATARIDRDGQVLALVHVRANHTRSVDENERFLRQPVAIVTDPRRREAPRPEVLAPTHRQAALHRGAPFGSE